MAEPGQQRAASSTRRTDDFGLMLQNQLVCVAVLALVAPAHSQDDAGLPEARRVIDFEKDVRPILAEHCLNCHNGMTTKGGLRLDRKKYIDRGGHTGNPILGSSQNDSELYHRIISEDPRYRMPRDGRLADEQIETISLWIAQGAPWVDPDTPEEQPDSDNGPTSSAGGRGDIPAPAEQGILATYFPSHLRIVQITAGVLLLFAVLLQRIKRGEKTRTLDPDDKPSVFVRFATRIGPRHLTMAFGILGLAGMVLHLQVQHRELVKLRGEVAYLNPNTKPTDLLADDPEATGLFGSTGPIPYRPRHPKRMGGVYYRGNDERTPELFNNGFYRTSLIRLALVDGSGQPLDYGDVVANGDASVRLEIERSLNATPALFTSRVMGAILVSRQTLDGGGTADTPYKLRTEEEGEHWSVQYPLDPIPADGRYSDIIYIYQGYEANGRVMGQYLYALICDLHVVAGALTEDSELWMGSLLRIPNMVFTPSHGIPMEEWFDFRPIPEITGENATDPTALGIDEHLGK